MGFQTNRKWSMSLQSKNEHTSVWQMAIRFYQDWHRARLQTAQHAEYKTSETKYKPVKPSGIFKWGLSLGLGNCFFRKGCGMFHLSRMKKTLRFRVPQPPPRSQWWGRWHLCRWRHGVKSMSSQLLRLLSHCICRKGSNIFSLGAEPPWKWTWRGANTFPSGRRGCLPPTADVAEFGLQDNKGKQVSLQGTTHYPDKQM